MRKIFIALTSLLLTIAGSETLYADCVLLDESAKKEIMNKWSSSKTVTYTISTPRPAGQLTFNFSKSGAALGGVTVTAKYNDGSSQEIIDGKSDGSQSYSFDKKIVTELQFKGTGTLSKQISNVRLTQAAYFNAPSITDFGSAKINTVDATQTTTMDWSDVAPMQVSLTGEGASQFSYTMDGNAQTCAYGTAVLSVTYKHNIVGSHTATLSLSNGAYSYDIPLTGITERKDQVLSWSEEWEVEEPAVLVGTTITGAATATSLLPVTYTSSDESIMAVTNNGQALQAIKTGEVIITATQVGNDEWAEATPISKTFIVYDKFTPVFWLNNTPDQTEADLKVGESITINIENTTDALQIACGDELAYTMGEGVLTITALAATDNATITLTQPETATIFSATRTFTLHITKNTASLTHNLLTDYYVDDEIAFADLYTATNTEVEVSILSSDEAVIKVEGDRLHAVGAGTATVTISQAENYKWTALTAEQTVTVSKHANAIVWSFAGENADSKTLSYNEAVAVTCTSDNTDTESSPITIAQTAGEDIATYNAEQQTITASYHNGTATWTVSQPENYKYLAAEATITVTVAAIQGGCDIINNSDEFDVPYNSTKGETTWMDINAAAQLTFDAKMQFWSTGNMEIEAYINGNWTKIQSIGTGSLSSDSYNTFSYDLAAEVQGIRFKNAGTLARYVKNVKVSRRQHLTPSETTLALPANEIGGQTTATFTLTWSSCADEIRLVSDNPKFTIDNPVISTNGGSGTANITVAYSSDEMENATATLTLYTPYQQTTIALTATTGKKTQTITWELPETILTTDHITLQATAATEISYQTDNTDIALISADNTLTILRAGVVRLTATAIETDEYQSATLSRDITISLAVPQITTLPTAGPAREGEPISTLSLIGGEADVAGAFEWAVPSDTILAAGIHSIAVRFVPANVNFYQTVDTVIRVEVIGKQPQTITWDDNIATLPVDTGALTLNATAQSNITYTSSNPQVAYIDGNILHIVTYGTVTVTATAEETDQYQSATISRDIAITALTPEILSNPTISILTVGQSLSYAVITDGEASTAGMFVWTDDEDIDAPFTEAGQYPVHLQFIPYNTDWYTIVSNIELTITVIPNASTSVISAPSDGTLNLSSDAAQKILHNGHILILRGEQTYDLQGHLLRR